MTLVGAPPASLPAVPVQPKDKALPALIAIPWMVLTTLILAYSGPIGEASILVLYTLWYPWIFIKGTSIVIPPKGASLQLAYMLLCCLSVFWSDYRGVTLRAALELVSMLGCIFIIIRLVPMSMFIRGLIIGCCAVLLVSLANGNYAVDPFGGGYALVGLLGSKNQVGQFAEIGLLLVTVFFFTTRRLLPKLIYTVLPALLFLLCLKQSHSASSLVSLAATLMVLGGMYLLNHIPQRVRMGSFVALAIVFVLVGGVAVATGMHNLLLQGLGKDTTLTGRTYLWSEGARIGSEAPFSGVGYMGFWVPFRPDAERLWYFFGVGKGGFHFHDLYVEVFVELGCGGLFLIMSLVLVSLYKSFRAVIVGGLTQELLVLLGLGVMYFIRSFVEVDTLGPFGIGPLMLYSILPRLAIWRRGFSPAVRKGVPRLI